MRNKIKNLLMAQRYRTDELDYDTWVFSSVDNCNFNYNSQYLFLYVREHLPEVQPLYVMNDDAKREALSAKYGKEYFVDSNHAEGMKKVLASGVWFTSAGLPAYEWKAHPERIVVNLWHGIPLKKIALLEENKNKRQRLYFKRMFSEKYSCILTTGGGLVSVMAQSFDVPEDVVKVWGQPRNDVLWQGSKRKEVVKQLQVEEATKLILYAPTYRDRGETRLFPFADYDKGTLENYLAERGWHICIRMHLGDDAQQDVYTSPHIHFMNEDVIEDVALWMNAFDLLITDYSSIYLDYLLLDRPMLFLPYDKDEYLRFRGMNFDYEKSTPGPKPDTMKAFLEAMGCLLEGEDLYRDRRRACNDFFNQVRRPCCGYICEEVKKMITKKKPG